ncbi:DUF6773 family protein [Enterococcus mundtii]|uniref:DUF3278 domain-containing protein n=1 Tax=Enterococcus mundtii TaxID=53346 RepID=A0A2S7RSD2_ENTMU|nr:DUF6773 family protein [Enterococcus mundtii]PQF22574.1 hypothetical protein CUS89_10610 [Enterococcus mundtii]
MKKNRQKDERIIQINNQIQSEAFLLLLVLLGTSIFVKSYLLEQPVSGMFTELLLIGVAFTYILIRGSLIGHELIDPSKHAKKLRVAAVIAGSLLVSAITGIRNYSLYQDLYTGYFDPHFLAVLGITFLSSLLFMVGLLFVVSSVNRFGQRRLERRIEDEEE